MAVLAGKLYGRRADDWWEKQVKGVETRANISTINETIIRSMGLKERGLSLDDVEVQLIYCSAAIPQPTTIPGLSFKSETAIHTLSEASLTSDDLIASLLSGSADDAAMDSGGIQIRSRVSLISVVIDEAKPAKDVVRIMLTKHPPTATIAIAWTRKDQDAMQLHVTESQFSLKDGMWVEK